MARASPRSLVLSKNTVSPSHTARTTEMASSAKARPDIPVTPANPPVRTAQPRIRALPSVERTAFSVTELKTGESARTSRPITAQESAQPTAYSAPRLDSERTVTRLYGQNGAPARLLYCE